jgi:ribosomal protein S18 acetylase RimI-like enzyme
MAVPADAAVLARFAEHMFRATFAAENTARDMDEYCAGAFSLEQQTRELGDPRITTIVAEDEQGALVGYAQLRDGPVPSALSDAATIELSRLYVERSRHGGGVAQSLMRQAFAAARARSATRMWLGVWERNRRALAFYRKMGFEDIGAHEFMLGRDRQIDRVMARDVPG